MKDSCNFFNLNDKTVIITGGLGQLGLGYIKALQSCGAGIGIFDIKRECEAADILKKQPDIKYYQTDITSRDSLRTSFDAFIQDFKKIDVLINNAALDFPPECLNIKDTMFENLDDKIWDKTFEVNSKGVFLCCQIIGGHMARNTGGSIINISSIYGMVSPDQRIYQKDGEILFYKPVPYGATKSSLYAFTRYLATYWAKKNVRVNILTLGGVFNNQPEYFVHNYCERVPMGRMANVDDYCGAVIFLASRASSYMTGSNLIIDGGLLCW
ncbi:MAG: SDR family oxidoreductase [Spirochaetales bacterium]|nr:SDR family oxidoreductase [Spirochaetales bacterium]